MDALDASMLSFELQPLDTLRIALENEPAFIESSMPKDDHTLTYVAFITNLLVGSCTTAAQALLEGSGIQCVPCEADGA